MVNDKSRILITAKTSFIGNAFEKWASNAGFEVEKISCRSDEWKRTSFSGFDAIVHVAGIAHVNARRGDESRYYKVNRDLTVELANKAKNEGVKKFIFLSSMIVYGESNKRNSHIFIDKNSKPNPSGFYGDSKLQAEQKITLLQDENFHVVSIRCPMVYGYGSKGNYEKLSKISRILPLVPDIENSRSMIHIDSLCEFIRLMIVNNEKGIFFPQNSEYTNTTQLICTIRKCHGKRTIRTKMFNPFIMAMSRKINFVNKVFGTFAYDLEMSNYKENYRIYSLEESIKVTERRDPNEA